MSSMRSHDRLPPSVAVPSQGRTIPVRAAPSTRPLADIVPGLVGVSVGRLAAGGAPSPWAARDAVVSALDACQYIAGGPCVRAAVERPRRRAEPVCLGEAAPWGLFIRACRAAGV